MIQRALLYCNNRIDACSIVQVLGIVDGMAQLVQHWNRAIPWCDCLPTAENKLVI